MKKYKKTIFIILSIFVWSYIGAKDLSANSREEVIATSPAQLCIFSRKKYGTLFFPFGKFFHWGHSIVVHVEKESGKVTLIESPSEIKIGTGEKAYEELIYFSRVSDAPKAGICFDLTNEQEENFQGLLIGQSLQEMINRVHEDSYNLLVRNCVHLTEDIFEDVTSENLKVRGVMDVGIASPDILFRRIIDKKHPFQLNDPYVTTYTKSSDVVKFLRQIIRNDTTVSEDSLYRKVILMKLKRRFRKEKKLESEKKK